MPGVKHTLTPPLEQPLKSIFQISSSWPSITHHFEMAVVTSGMCGFKCTYRLRNIYLYIC